MTTQSIQCLRMCLLSNDTWIYNITGLYSIFTTNNVCKIHSTHQNTCKSMNYHRNIKKAYWKFSIVQDYPSITIDYFASAFSQRTFLKKVDYCRVFSSENAIILCQKCVLRKSRPEQRLKGHFSSNQLNFLSFFIVLAIPLTFSPLFQ